jgi:hypothetical protein
VSGLERGEPDIVRTRLRAEIEDQEQCAAVYSTQHEAVSYCQALSFWAQECRMPDIFVDVALNLRLLRQSAFSNIF